MQGITVGKNGGGLFSNKVKSALDDADWVIVNFLETSNRPSKKYGVNTEVIKSLSGLVDDKKWSINLFANPYRLDEEFQTLSNKVSSLIVAYQDDFRTQEEVANASSADDEAEKEVKADKESTEAVQELSDDTPPEDANAEDK